MDGLIDGRDASLQEQGGWDMSRRFGLAMMLAGLLLWPGLAQAQRGMSRYANTPAMTPYGPVFNPTQTPEWRQAGGNPVVYQQIMMQKMAAAEQAAFQKQWAAYQKQMKLQGATAPVATVAPTRPRKKRPTLKPSAAATAKADASKAAKPTPADASKVDEEDEEVAKPAATSPAVDPKAPVASTAKPAAPK